MKMREGLVNNIEDHAEKASQHLSLSSATLDGEDDDANLEKVQLSILLCDQELSSSIDNLKNANEDEGDHKDNDHGVGFDGTIIFEDEGKYIDTKKMQQLLSKIKETYLGKRRLSSGKSSRSIYDSFFWTSNVLMQENNRRLRRIQSISSEDESVIRVLQSHRSKWQRILSNGIGSSESCSNFLDEIQIEASTKNTYILTMHTLGRAFGMNNKDCILSLAAALVNEGSVCSVEYVPTASIPLNDYASWIIQGNNNIHNDRPFWQSNFDGTGEIVQVSDSGLDTDHCYFWDSSQGELKDGTIQPNRRKVVSYYPYADSQSTYHDHGTHVVGTLLGQRSVDGTVGGTDSGTSNMNGVARGAKVAFYDVGLDTACCTIGLLRTMFDAGVAAGARLHSASWGYSNHKGQYTSKAMEMDEYIYSVDDGFLPIISAGNDGDDLTYNSIHPPATAKNVVSVGSSLSAGRDLDQINGGLDLSGFSSVDILAHFSSKGDTRNRIKPDIIAPGYTILSMGGNPDTVGECDENGDMSNLVYMSGTSMSAPSVAGALAIMRQYLPDHNPSASLLKAILLNGGLPLNGALTSENGPIVPTAMYDAMQGFGKANLANSLPLNDNFQLDWMDRISLNAGDVHSYEYNVSGSQCNVSPSITLAWTDPPATTGCVHCVVNGELYTKHYVISNISKFLLDLDLVVTINSVDYFPNGLSIADSQNNVERVQIEQNLLSPGDTLEISVRGTNMVSLVQKYSLVVKGCLVNINGNWTATPTRSPEVLTSSYPSSYPTESPSYSPGALRQLVTNYMGDNGQAGTMFDIIALSDITVHSFDLHIRDSFSYQYEIYTKLDTYLEADRDPSKWLQVGSGSIIGNGLGMPSPLPRSVYPVSIFNGTRQAFYVTLTTNAMGYGAADSNLSYAAEDSNLQILLGGAGKTYPFGSTYRPRVFNGAIYYSIGIDISYSPSQSPSLTRAPTPPVMEIPVTYAAGNGQAGNMFDIVASFSVIIRSFSLHTKTTEIYNFELYTKPGSFQNNLALTDRSQWDEMGRGSVTGGGIGNSTPLPMSLVSPTTIRGGNTQAFYITLDRDGLWYTNGSQLNAVYVRDNYVSILQGVGKSYPFGQTFSPRIFNGAILYSSEVNLETPSMSPTYLAAPTVSKIETLQTTMLAGNGQAGNMFDLVNISPAFQDLYVHNFDIHVKNTITYTCFVFTKTGSLISADKDPTKWLQIGEIAGVTGLGMYRPTPLSSYPFDPIAIFPGQTRAFYVTLNGNGLAYTNGNSLNSVYSSDSNIQFLQGVGKTYLFGSTYSPRIFNGIIYYASSQDSLPYSSITNNSSSFNNLDNHFDAPRSYNDIDTGYKRYILNRVNSIRSQSVISLLCYSDDLDIAAQSHSMDMVRNSLFRHNGSDGSSPESRVSETGFQWTLVEENIGRNGSSVNDFMDAIMVSTAHSETILNKSYTHIGVATVDSYWTLIFAAGSTNPCSNEITYVGESS